MVLEGFPVGPVTFDDELAAAVSKMIQHMLIQIAIECDKLL